MHVGRWRTIVAKIELERTQSTATHVFFITDIPSLPSPGLHFIVDDDLRRWTSLRLDTAGRATLTVLRTLRRIREIRGPGAFMRYAVICADA